MGGSQHGKAPPEASELFGDTIDMTAFDQILEMDEPDNDEFSSSIVFGFFAQARETFAEMDKAL